MDELRSLDSMYIPHYVSVGSAPAAQTSKVNGVTGASTSASAGTAVKDNYVPGAEVQNGLGSTSSTGLSAFKSAWGDVTNSKGDATTGASNKKSDATTGASNKKSDATTGASKGKKSGKGKKGKKSHHNKQHGEKSSKKANGVTGASKGKK
jgi:hypothetical protein